MEGAEFKYWINRLNAILTKYKVAFKEHTRAWDWEHPDTGYIDEFNQMVDELLLSNRYVKYVAPEVFSRILKALNIV